MEPWVLKALQRWPNVPAVFGWLSLDRRGRWLIKDELISRPQIIETINANYAADEFGRWYFQNGPQRGYMRLAYAPFVLSVSGNELMTHTAQRVAHVSRVYLDEEGSLLLLTEHGPALLIDTDLDWALTHIHHKNHPVEVDALASVLALPSGAATELMFSWHSQSLSIARLDFAVQPDELKFVRDPQPRPNEHVSTAAQD